MKYFVYNDGFTFRSISEEALENLAGYDSSKPVFGPMSQDEADELAVYRNQLAALPKV